MADNESENYAEDMRHVALALASPDLDDDETERNVSEAMWLIKNGEARGALSDGLGIEAVDACTTDDGYERTLNLLLNALVLEVEAVADAAEEAGRADDSAPPPKPTDASDGISRAVCRLVVRSSLGTPDGPPTEMDMRRESMDILSETLSGEHELGEIVVESLLNCARSPLGDGNRGEYGPALVLAHHANAIAPPPEEERKFHSSAEDKASAFRRDLMDLLGRRIFVLGGNAKPATAPEVGLCSPLISLLTKDEFDGSILRPLKFKLMSAPDSAMDTLAAFVDALNDAGNGKYVEPHLGGGTNLVGTAVKVLKKGGDGMVPAAKAAASLARASPAKGAEAVTEALSSALKESGDDDESARVGLCLGLEAAARALLSEKDEGRGQLGWVGLANDVALPALEGSGGPDGRNAAKPWYQIAERSPPSAGAAASAAKPAAAAAAAASGSAAAAAGGAAASGGAAAAARGRRGSSGRDAADAAAKNRARGGPPGSAPPPASRPGAVASSNAGASALDDRIAAKARSASRERGPALAAAAGAGAAGAAGGNVASNSRDAADAAAKARARGGGGGGGPPGGRPGAGASRRPGAQSAHDLDARIAAKAGQRGPGGPGRGGGGRGGGPGGPRRSAPPGAAPGGGRTREQLDELDQRIRSKSMQAGAPGGPPSRGGGDRGAAPVGPEDDDWDRIRTKGGGGGGPGGPGQRGSYAAQDDEDRGGQKIVVASGAGTSYGVGPGPGGSIPVKGGDDDKDEDRDGGRGAGGGGAAPRGGGGAAGGYDDVGGVAYPPDGAEGYPDGGGGAGEYGDLRYGELGGGMDAPAGADGLAVAVAVSPDEDEAFIPAAIEYDPDSKPPLYKNRRFRIYSIAAVILLILVVVAVVVAVVFNAKDPEVETVEVEATPPPTPAPTPSPTTERYTMGVREQILELTADTETKSAGIADIDTSSLTPEQIAEMEADEAEAKANRDRAMNWILNEDPMQLPKDSPFIIQRYLVALLYFSANRDGVWRHCAASDDPEDQTCQAVVYDQEGDPYNDTFARMLSGVSECDWYGVRCTGGDNFVRELEMIENNMTGTLPPELAEMPVLQRLSFIMNELEGTIPPEFGDMRHLIDIEFHYNFFTGTIPDSLYNADNLIRLNLGGNMLTGSISSSIKNLRSLVGLFTFDNQFEGSIPPEVGELSYLSYTRWSYNTHTGTIPTEIGELTNLIELYLQWNKLTGSVPPTVGELVYLEDLFLNNNQLSGTLPIQFYSMEGLTYFYCFDNSLSGQISPLIRRLTNLERFIIRRNFFTGEIPRELAELKNISMIWAHYNDFVGTVSEDFCELYEPPYQLSSFYADCGPSDLTGPPAVVCDCCTDCCDTVQETCLKNE